MNSGFYKEIIAKLETLIRKEYSELIIRGIIFSLIIGISAFVLFSFVEWIGFTKSIVRTILFLVLLIILIASIGYQILLPLLKYFNVFQNRNYQQSACKVGRFFPEIKDDLLNALQLVSTDKSNSIYSTSLLDAAFKNVYERSKPIRFESIVDF